MSLVQRYCTPARPNLTNRKVCDGRPSRSDNPWRCQTQLRAGHVELCWASGRSDAIPSELLSPLLPLRSWKVGSGGEMIKPRGIAALPSILTSFEFVTCEHRHIEPSSRRGGVTGGLRGLPSVSEDNRNVRQNIPAHRAVYQSRPRTEARGRRRGEQCSLLGGVSAVVILPQCPPRASSG